VHTSRPNVWSTVALVLAGIGVLASTWLIAASDGDPTHVRWPLVLAPIVVCTVPVVVRRREARIGAAVALGGWCVLASLSIGFLLLPALGATLAAVVQEER
jgi:hypothetical protein